MMGNAPVRRLTLAVALLAASCGAPAQNHRPDSVDDESTADELLKRGKASAAIGDTTRAEQYLVAALRAGADEKIVTQNLLVVCISDRRYPVALEYAEQYLRKHPRDLEITFAAASIYAAAGETSRARQLLELILQAKPDWADVHYVLATVLRSQDQAESMLADQHDLKYLRLAPSGAHAETARARLRGALP